LLIACLGSEEAVSRLSAIYNLDWGHHPDERAIPEQFLSEGAEVVVRYVRMARPRLVVPLSKLVWRHLIPAFMRSGATVLRERPLESHESLLLHIPADRLNQPFDAVVARPYNHPSRHFLTAEKIDAFARELAPFQKG
jgi:hypothetical protein